MVKALYSDQKNENMDPSDKSELPLKGVWHRGVPGIEEGHAGKIQLVWGNASLFPGCWRRWMRRGEGILGFSR